MHSRLLCTFAFGVDIYQQGEGVEHVRKKRPESPAYLDRFFFVQGDI
jgi:hypothetical protein